MPEASTPEPTGAPSGARGDVGVSRFLLVLVCLVGFLLGFIPACFVVDPHTVRRFAIVAVPLIVVVIITLARGGVTAASRPRGRDWVLATAAATFVPAGAAVFFVALHFVFGWAGWILSRTVGWPERPHAFEYAAHQSAYAIQPFVVGAFAASYRNVVQQLCPDRAGVGSAFSTTRMLPVSMWLSAVGALVPGALLLVIAAVGLTAHPTIALVFLVVILTAGAPLFELTPSTKRVGEDDATVLLEHILTRAGYTVVRSPRTGQADLDPLLADLAMYVRAPSGAPSYAVDVVSVPPGKTLSWSAGVSLLVKQRAVAQAQGQEPDEIVPVLIVLKGEVEPMLRSFVSQEHVHLVEGLETAVLSVAGRHGANAPLSTAEQQLVARVLPIPHHLQPLAASRV